MPAGDLTNYLLAGMAAVLRKTTWTDAPPTKAQCIAALNEATRDMVKRFAPVKLADNRISMRRVDLLTRQLFYEAETGGSGFCEWPMAGHVRKPNIVIIYLVEVGGYAAVEVASEDIVEMASGEMAVTAAAPVFAEGFGPAANSIYDGIYYLPAAGTPTVGYHGVLMPEPLEDSSAEDWPLDDDLMPLALFRGLAIILQQSSEPARRQVGSLFNSWYETIMAFLLNPLAVVPSGSEVV